MRPRVKFLDWGTTDYAEALERQRGLFDRLIGNKSAEVEEPANSDRNAGTVTPEGRRFEAGWLIFCEHPHVYTLGRSGRVENLLVSGEFLRSRGAALHRTERGGDVTYHGPGQIVGYPVLDLERVGLGLREYIAALEQAVIDTVAEFGRNADGGFGYAEIVRIPGKTGVWIKDASGERKICAIGVKASRGVVMHGFALNVSTDLGWFDLINPCGFVGGAVTSMEREAGVKVGMSEVKKLLRERLAENLGIMAQE